MYEMSIFLILAIGFLIVAILGGLLEKLHIPSIFASLIAGMLIYLIGGNAIQQTLVPDGAILGWLATFGMYMLLFLIGLELDLGTLKGNKKLITKTMATIITLDAVTGAILVHYVFGYDIVTAILVAVSFATVGEAFILPILEEFNLVNTPLGQTIIGIGTLDDIIELISLMGAVFLIGGRNNIALKTSVGSLGVLVLITLVLFRLRHIKYLERVQKENITILGSALLSFFVWLGAPADMEPLACILAGVTLGNILPLDRKATAIASFKNITYGLFGPIFFLWVGLNTNLGLLREKPQLVLLVIAVSNSAKILGSLIATRKQLVAKVAIFMGISLSIRFSTSIVIINYLFSNGLVGEELFTTIVASSIVFKFIIPPALAYLASKWNIAETLDT